MLQRTYSKIFYNFARQTKIKTTINQKLKSDLKEEHLQTDRIDPKDPSIDDDFISQMHLDLQHLPLNIQKKCQSVFSKYPASKVRDMGKEYMKLYQSLHANEKPIDLTNVPPFENSENLSGDIKDENFIYLASKKKVMEMQENPSTKNNKNEENKDKKQIQDTQDKFINKSQIQLIYTQNLAIAYLLKKMPGTFAVACRVLTEIKFRIPEFNPKTFLDFGAGLGSGSTAFSDMFKDVQIFACEPSTPMRKLGKYITQDLPINWIQSLSQTLDPSQFDIVYCGYVLEELQSASERILTLEALYAKTSNDGYMILVEPGSPKGFRFINDFRNWAIKKDAMLIAPCPHNKECPLVKQISWCNFEQPVAAYPKRIFPNLAQQKNFHNEKFSFLIIKKTQSKLNSPSFEWARIIRPVLKRNKHRIFDICNQDGQIERIVQAKSWVENYKICKKLKNGDLWRFEQRIPNKFRKETSTGKRLW